MITKNLVATMAMLGLFTFLLSCSKENDVVQNETTQVVAEKKLNGRIPIPGRVQAAGGLIINNRTELDFNFTLFCIGSTAANQVYTVADCTYSIGGLVVPANQEVIFASSEECDYEPNDILMNSSANNGEGYWAYTTPSVPYNIILRTGEFVHENYSFIDNSNVNYDMWSQFKGGLLKSGIDNGIPWTEFTGNFDLNFPLYYNTLTQIPATTTRNTTVIGINERGHIIKTYISLRENGDTYMEIEQLPL